MKECMPMEIKCHIFEMLEIEKYQRYVQRNEGAKMTKSMAWYSVDIHHSM